MNEGDIRPSVTGAFRPLRRSARSPLTGGLVHCDHGQVQRVPMPGEEVWAETTDGGLLRQLFGYYPTLHDASIRLLEIDRKADRVAMTLDYRDMVGQEPSQDLAVTIRLEWSGITHFELPLDETDLMGLSFGREGTRIVTDLEVYPGVFGRIVSEGFEAVLVQVDAMKSDDRPLIRFVRS